MKQNSSSLKKKIGDYSFYLSDLIGSGYSSKVYKCFKRSAPQESYAIKVISLEGMASANFELLKNEVKILSVLNHPNVVKFHQVYYTSNNCYVITDLCENGTLQDYITNSPKSWEEPHILEELYLIFEQVLEGCRYLANMNILHRDIKPANIFNKQGIWKIGDFGFARFVDGVHNVVKEKFRIGSPLYMPLETLRHNIYSIKTDSFALGVLLFNLFTKEYPWTGRNRKELELNLESKEFPLHLLRHVDPFVVEFICGLLILDMDLRFTVANFILNPENILVGDEEIELLESQFSVEVPPLGLNEDEKIRTDFGEFEDRENLNIRFKEDLYREENEVIKENEIEPLVEKCNQNPTENTPITFFQEEKLLEGEIREKTGVIEKTETTENNEPNASVYVEKEESVDTCWPSSINCDSEKLQSEDTESETRTNNKSVETTICHNKEMENENIKDLYENLEKLNAKTSYSLNNGNGERLNVSEKNENAVSYDNFNEDLKQESPKYDGETSEFNIQRDDADLCMEKVVTMRDMENKKALEEEESIEEFDGNKKFQQILSVLANLDIIQKIKVSKFILYIANNLTKNKEFIDEISENLCEKLRCLLKSCVLSFGWIENSGQVKYLEEFESHIYSEISTIQEIFNIYTFINQKISQINKKTYGSSQNIRFSNVLKVKMNQMKNILKLSIKGEMYFIKEFLNQLVLHPDFEKVFVTQQQITDSETL